MRRSASKDQTAKKAQAKLAKGMAALQPGSPLDLGLTSAAKHNHGLARPIVVAKMILQGQAKSDILAECVSAWKCSERSVVRYWADASALIAEDAAAHIAVGVEWHIRLRMDLIRDSLAAGDRKGALAAAKDLASLQALYAADKAALARAGLDSTLHARAKQGDSQLADILLAAYGGPQPPQGPPKDQTPKKGETE